MGTQSGDLSTETSGLRTDTVLVRTFDREVNVTEAVSVTVAEATERWSDLSASTHLAEFVDASRLDGLFPRTARYRDGHIPEAKFRYQSCWVVVLYGERVQVIVERDR